MDKFEIKHTTKSVNLGSEVGVFLGFPLDFSSRRPSFWYGFCTFSKHIWEHSFSNLNFQFFFSIFFLTKAPKMWNFRHFRCQNEILEKARPYPPRLLARRVSLPSSVSFIFINSPTLATSLEKQPTMDPVLETNIRFHENDRMWDGPCQSLDQILTNLQAQTPPNSPWRLNLLAMSCP